MENTLLQKLKDFTHKRSDNDVRGSCGNPCYQCQKDIALLDLIEKHLAERYELGKKHGAEIERYGSIGGAERSTQV